MVRKIWIGLALVAAVLAAIGTQVGAARKSLYATPAPTATEAMAFPKDFFWGASIAAQQAESQQPTDWTAFELDAFR